MGNRITVCHWTEGGRWEAVEIATDALAGHEQHRMDIWPPVEGVTDGMNWPLGENVYINGCAIQAQPSPSPGPSLPESGTGVHALLLLATLLIAIGLWLLNLGNRQ